MGDLGEETRQPFSGERRQITVLFVDIVGFSNIASTVDAEDLQHWLENYYQRTAKIIAARGGKVTEYLGDGVVALFGLQNADELAAQQAVAAALSAVASLEAPVPNAAPVNLRAGVATGEVATRANSASSGLPPVTGVVTTLAQRIQEKAEPGKVVIADTTHALLRDGFLTKELPAQSLKGFNSKTTLYEVTERKLRHINHTTDFFVGRSDEQKAILKSTKPCLIIGPAGIGKTALTKKIAGTTNTVCALFSDGLYANSSFQPFKRWLLELLDESDITLEKLSGRFPALRPEACMALALILGLPEGQRLLAEKSNTALRSLIEQSLWQAIRENGPKGLILVEDLHWLDEASFGVLRAILCDPGSSQYQILMTSRVNEDVTKNLADFEVSKIMLDKLSKADSEKMLVELGGNSITKKRRSALIKKSGGIPLFIEQLYKWAPDGEDVVIPSTLMDLLAEQIDKTGTAKEVLKRAAIIGQRFNLDFLQRLEPDANDLENDLARAVDQGVIERVDTNEWAFSHALLHQLAYHGLLRRARETYHARFANFLENDFPEIVARDPGLLAEHYKRAKLFESAIPAYLQAAQSALFQGAMADAETHTRNALELCQTAPQDMDVVDLEIACQTSLGSILMQSQGFSAAPVLEAFYAVQSIASEEKRPGQSSAPALFGSFSHAIISGDLESAAAFCDLLENVTKTSNADDDNSEIHIAHLAVQNCKDFYSGDFSNVLKYVAQIRDIHSFEKHAGMIMRYGMDVFAAAQMFETAAHAIMGRTDSIQKLVEETDEHQRAINVPVMQPYALIWGAVPLNYGGYKEQALARLHRGIEAANEQGADFWRIIGQAWLHVMEPDRLTKQDGREAFGNVIETLEAMGAHIGRPYFLAIHAHSLAQAGDIEAAYHQSRTAHESCAASGLLCWHPEMLRLHAAICKLAGRNGEAADALEQGYKAAQKQGAKLWELRIALDLEPTDPNRNQRLSTLVADLPDSVTLPEIEQAKAELLKA